MKRILEINAAKCSLRSRLLDRGSKSAAHIVDRWQICQLREIDDLLLQLCMLDPMLLRTKAVTLAYSGDASKNWRQCDPTSPVPPAISAVLGIFTRFFALLSEQFKAQRRLTLPE